MQRHYFVYITASGRNGTLYVGVTNDIVKRAWEHKSDAIAYEKRLKRWRRQWKPELIEKINPQWRDLFDDFTKA